MTSIEGRIAVLEDRDADRKKFEDEIRATLKLLLVQSSEWAGVRKTLAAIVTIITVSSGVVGFIIHEFWPHVTGKP